MKPKRLSVVSAVYNVDRYLEDFIASMEGQDRGLDDVEFVMVDDGSTDGSSITLEGWQHRRADGVRVLSKANGGQASARNLGLDHATGEWVTFIDPDDTVKADYLSRVFEAIDTHPELAMVATNRVIHQDETGTYSYNHPLHRMFSHRDQFKNLDEFPDFFHGSAPSAFFRRSVIEEHGLRFDERIKPNFEDGHFCQRYLLRTPVRLVAFLRSAEYYYRKRFDQSSTLQTGMTLPSRFLDVPRYGYLDLLREAAAIDGRVPEWLQNMIIYELSHYIGPEDAVWNRPTACHGEIAVRFVQTLHEIRQYLDAEVIRSFNVRPLRPEWRQLLLYGLAESDWHSPYVVLHRRDADREQVLLSFRFTGTEPNFSVISRGRPTDPVATKVRNLTYWEHDLLKERLIWVSSAGSLRVKLAGTMVELRTSWKDFAPTAMRPSALRAVFARATTKQKQWTLTTSLSTLIRTRSIIKAAASAPVRRRFADAWVLMDRVDDAADSGENLFRYLRTHHRKINAWFVVHEKSPDFTRLKQEGFRRIIPYGGLLYRLLMLNCQHLISSHVDEPIVNPVCLRPYVRERTWKFTFLQHGVIKDDLSGWLNPKRIDLMVTSTPGEYQSIAGDGNRYVLTSKEVKRTGLPRFDRLRELSKATRGDDRRMIIVAPTWRDSLSEAIREGQFKRSVKADFLESDYARNWLGLLGSANLRRACDDAGLHLGFLPHPNMQPILDEIELPDHVRALHYADNDVQELFAQAAMLVTDYSSTAFNAAYVDQPVVYFQFDSAEVERGSHRGRKGYFSYADDGFGPVGYDVAETERAIVKIVEAGCRLQPPYAERVERTFPDRDGECCRRVVAAIRAI